MSYLEQIESNDKRRVRLLFTVRKFSNMLLILSGMLIVIGLFMFFYINNYKPIKYVTGKIPDKDELRRSREYWSFMQYLFRSMIISGLIGFVIFTPTSLLLSVRLKDSKTRFIVKEYGCNKDIFESQRNPNKRVKPFFSEIRIISWGDFV